MLWHMCVHAHVFVYVCMCMRVSVCVCMYACAGMSVCIYVYIVCMGGVCCILCCHNHSLSFLAVFQRRCKYNIPVYMCAHPELNEYIRHVLDGIKPLLEAGQVGHIAVVIRNKVSTPMYTHNVSCGCTCTCICACVYMYSICVYRHTGT